MKWVELAVSILAGLAVTIPLVVKLVEYVQKAVKEQNWNRLLSLIIAYMEEAESKFEDGATRKEWVMAMIATSAREINYDIDMELISGIIDSLCSMSKIVNPPAEKAGE